MNDDYPATLLRTHRHRHRRGARWHRCWAARRVPTDRRLGRRPAFRAEGEARHLSVPIGRAVADGAVRLQAAAQRTSRAPICPIPSARGSGSPACRPRSRASRSCRRSFSSQQHGKSGAWVSELMPHTAKIADELSLHQVDVHRGDQSRSGGHVPADRIADRRPAQHRRVAGLRTRQRERRICRRSS